MGAELASQCLLEIKGLKTSYSTEEGIVSAVDGIDLKINQGEAVGLVGESGCGKSTVALSLLRLVPPSGKIVGGEVWFEGNNLLEMSEDEMRKIRGAKIAAIFQNPMSSLNPVFTIMDQIGEAITLHQNIEKSNVKNSVADILEKVGIHDSSTVMHSYPHEYSGGMKQRAMIAMALSCNPKLLIADEPTTNLDVTIQAQILDLLKKLRKDFDTSILLISHDLGTVCSLCEKVAVMYAGKIVEYTDILTLFENARHPYTRALLKCAPRLGDEVDEFHFIGGAVPNLIHPPSGCRFHPRCEYVTENCRVQEPRLVEVERGHQVACLRAAEFNF